MKIRPVNLGITQATAPAQVEFNKKNTEQQGFDYRQSSAAIRSTMGSLVIKRPVAAKNIDELKIQIDKTQWMNEKDKENFLRNLDRISPEHIELLSETLYKFDELPEELKEVVSSVDIILSFERPEKEDIEKIKNFDPKKYHMLDSNLRKNHAKKVMSLCPRYNITDPTGVNKVYNALDEDTRIRLVNDCYFMFSGKKENEKNYEVASTINELPPNIKKQLPLRDLVGNQAIDTDILKHAVKFINSLNEEDLKGMDGYFIGEFLKEDYSYFYENMEEKPVCGTDDFKKFRTKEELKKELSVMKTGAFPTFTTPEIEKIINNENDIGELSLVIDGIKKSGIELKSREWTKILLTEGIALKNIQERLDYLNEVNNSEELKTTARGLNDNKSEFITASGKEFEQIKNNGELIEVINKHFPQFFENEISGCSNIFRFLKDSVVKKEILEKLIDSGIITPDIYDFRLLDILKNDKYNNIKDENIKFLNDIKNEKRLEYLSLEEKGGKTVPADLTWVLTLNLPEGYDLSKKDKVIDFLSEITKDDFDIKMGWKRDEIVSILTKKEEDDPYWGRKIKNITEELGLASSCERYEYYQHFSFEEMYKVLEGYKNSGVKLSYAAITKHGLKENLDFIEIANYIGSFDSLRGASVKSDEIMSLLEARNEEFNVRKSKEKIDRINEASEIIPPEIWQDCRNYILSDTFDFDGIELKPENVEYFSKLLVDEEFKQYFEIRNYCIPKIMSKDLDLNKLEENKASMIDFAKKYKNQEGFALYYDDDEIASFEGDFERLEYIIEELRTKYSANDISLSLEKTGAKFKFDTENEGTITIFCDGNLNIKSKSTEAECLTEDDEEFLYCEINDYERNLNAKVAKMPDPILGIEVPVEAEIEYLDNDGNIIKTKNYSKSDIDGVYNITEKYSTGETKSLTDASETTDGCLITREMESALGIKTYVDYKSSENGEEYYYTISDKNGNNLASIKRTTEIIDENKKITTINDKKYQVETDEDYIKIFDFQTSETTTLNLKELNPENDATIADLLKTMAGDELIAISKFVKKLTLTKRIESAMNWENGEMFIGPHKFVIEHELGHAKDRLNMTEEEIKNIKNPDDMISQIASNPELIEIFEKEKAAMKSVLPEILQEEANYFIDDKNHYGGKLGGLREVIAEVNAIQNCAKSHPLLQMRTQLLMEYFPETIAYLLNNCL